MVPKAAMARTTLTERGKRAGAVAAISGAGFAHVHDDD